MNETLFQGQDPSMSDIQNLPLVEAVIQETLRDLNHKLTLSIITFLVSVCPYHIYHFFFGKLCF